MIQFDSIDLQNASYVPRTFKHESAPDREMEILQLAREDGGILVSEKYASKPIVIQGTLKANTQAALETLIDSFKELLSRRNKNLDISFAGGTRRYVAYARSFSIDRDHFHLLFVPYQIEFVVPSGVGTDTSVTAALNAVDADPTYTGAVTFAGSAKPKPKITLTFGTGWTNAFGIRFLNTDSDEECIVTRSTIFANADVLIIDCETKRVTLNVVEIPFYRVLPQFQYGVNNFEIYAGDIVDQQFIPPASYTSENSIDIPYTGTTKVAMSFMVPHTDATYQGISLRLLKQAGIDWDLSVKIQTDTNGAPSGTAVTNATFSIPRASVGTTYSWITINSTNKFSLSANTRYWIVISGAGAGTGGWYHAEKTSGSAATYGKGNYVTYAPSTWTQYINTDLFFKLYFGGKVEGAPPNLILDIDYTRRYL